MSVAQSAKVWALRGLSAEERLVMLCLADGADDAGNCWPNKSTHTYIALTCEISKSSVIRAFCRMENLGFLIIKKTPGKPSKVALNATAKSVSTSVPQTPHQCLPDTTTSVPQTPHQCLPDTTPINKEERLLTSVNVSIHPPIPPKGLVAIREKKPSPKPAPKGNFEEFWKLYPKAGGSKQNALKKYTKAMKEVDHQTICNAIQKYKEFLDVTGYNAAYAATWLHQKRWGDDHDGATAEHKKRHAPRSKPESAHDKFGAAWAAAAGRPAEGQFDQLDELADMGEATNTYPMLESKQPGNYGGS